MKVTKNENIAYFDIDETLVNWCDIYDPESLAIDYYGEIVYVKPYTPHIRFLKSLKARGGYIIVHSGNGWSWAESVVKLLKLEEYVDEVKSKPQRVVDDADYSVWMPTRIFIQE